MTERSYSYHHGDLKHALVEAATDLLAAGGLEEFSLRGAAREIGVSPTATYRHFADRAALLREVGRQAYADLGTAIRRELDAQPRRADPAQAAHEAAVALGIGYVEWAVANPQLFKVVLAPDLNGSALTIENNPWLLLQGVVAALVDSGAADPSHQDEADIAIWSTVHGLATLLINGPVDLGPVADPRQWASRLTGITVAGLTKPA